jgi:two-component system chemotaxis response regulator CheY
MLQAAAAGNPPLAGLHAAFARLPRRRANLARLTGCSTQGDRLAIPGQNAHRRGWPLSAAETELEPMPADPSMPILVADDYNTMVRIIRNLLRQVGFTNVDDACDGTTALKRLREKNYSLVISDWNMEPMTGYELLKEMRADPKLAHVPFIMITAESKTENVIAAKKAGVSNYIVKPFNAATLKSKIDAVFQNRPSCAA